MISWSRRFTMKLTRKDKEFLERLRGFLDEKELSVEMKTDGFKRLVLRQNYGDKIEQAFGMSRQGVRWRFQRLFNELYTNSYLTICWIESNFGTDLRQSAIEIAKEHIALWKNAPKLGKTDVYRRQTQEKRSGLRDT